MTNLHTFLKRNFSDPIFSTMSKSPYFQILKNLFLAGPTWPAFLRANGLGRAKALKSEPGWAWPIFHVYNYCTYSTRNAKES